MKIKKWKQQSFCHDLQLIQALRREQRINIATYGSAFSPRLRGYVQGVFDPIGINNQGDLLSASILLEFFKHED